MASTNQNKMIIKEAKKRESDAACVLEVKQRLSCYPLTYKVYKFNMNQPSPAFGSYYFS